MTTSYGTSPLKSILLLGDSTVDSPDDAVETRNDSARNLLWNHPPTHWKILPDRVMDVGLSNGGLGGGTIPHYDTTSPDGLCHWNPANSKQGDDPRDIKKKWQCIAEKSGKVDYVMFVSLGYNDLFFISDGELSPGVYWIDQDVYYDEAPKDTFRSVYDPNGDIGTNYDAMTVICARMEALLQKMQDYGIKIIYVSEYPLAATTWGRLGQGKKLVQAGAYLGACEYAESNSNYEYFIYHCVQPWINANASYGHQFWDFLQVCVPGTGQRDAIQDAFEADAFWAGSSFYGFHLNNKWQIILKDFLYSKIAGL